MKWCIVAAMAVSLLFSGLAWAQEDDFDLDALLGDVGAPTDQAAEAAPVMEEAVEEVAEEAAPVAEEVVEAAVVTEEAVGEDVAALADDLAVEEIAEEAAVIAEEAVEEDVAALADDLAIEEMSEESADPLAEDIMAEAVEEDSAALADDLAVEEVAEEAAVVAEEAVEEDIAVLADDSVLEEGTEEAAVVAEEAAVEEDPFADLGMEPVEEAAPEVDTIEVAAAPTDDELLGDLFADDPTLNPEASEELAPVALEEVTEDITADFGDVDLEEEASLDSSIISPKKAKPAKTEEKLTKRQLKKLAKEAARLEEIRRQSAEADALKASEQGFAALRDKDYVLAEKAFDAALTGLPDRPQNDAVKEQIAWALADAKYNRALGMMKDEARLPEARKLLDAALVAAPTHRGAQKLEKRLVKLEARAAIPKKPAEQPATQAKAKTLDQMYDEARQWYKLKDYDRASEIFEQILVMDPYHKSTMRYLRKIEADKFKLATYEREARVQGMMTEVRRAWSPPIRANIKMPDPDEQAGGVDRKPAAARLQEKMQEIIIPAVEFRQANINDVVNFLVEASIAADKDGEGVNIILNLGSGNAAAAPAPMMADTTSEADPWGDLGGEDFGAPMAPVGGGGNVSDITLNLRRISMLNAIKYITEVAGLKYRIEDSAVIITPINAPTGHILTRMYPVQPSFMDVIVDRQVASDTDRGDAEFTSMGGQVSMTKGDVKEFFEKTGVKFPTGASITYNAAISQLIVANTADNLETFERILQQLNVVPNQVEIEARFIEVAQNDLEELGLQWILNDNYEFATKKDGSGQRMQVNANQNGLTQGLRFFGFNSGNRNVEPISVLTQTANQTMLGGILSASSVLTNPEVTVVIQALSMHGGTDLLSAPRVTTRSGVNAQIQVVKEIIYPTEFEVTQPTMNTDGNVTMSPVVTPGTFTTRETGVILNVTPTVGPDGYTIDLVMAPEVAELVDWIQYGSAITVTTGIIGARQENTYLFNMPQPIFTSRNVTTSIVIWDGQTVVMGGLIREELTTIKDKVPILGDIPILGWFFRSEGQYSRKMNLLIFVTARLVDPAGRPIHTEANMAMPGTGIEAASAAVGATP